ncbi:D-alanyl-D-alanine carboxypeptidase family protein [Kineococcus sp. NBC_00420]|uniref:M15 family metallopeptidase n=1 Tax=Kineococcus sp. NBC_00420 TaxID=2903564 RepID=UPI002E1BEE8A
MLSPQARPARRSQRLRATLLLAGAVVGSSCLSLGVVAPATAVTVTPASITPISVGTDTPSPQQLAEAQRQAAASAAQAAQVQSQLDAAQSQLDALAKQASTALENFQQADEARRAAVDQEAVQQERLRQAEITLAEGKKDLGQWAASSYRGGAGGLREYSGLVDVLRGGATDDTASALASVKRIGDGRSNAVEAYEQAQRDQIDATQKAAAARLEAQTQADIATSAKQQADGLLAQQRTQVAALAVLQSTAAGTANSDAERAANLATAKAQADAALAAASSGGYGAVGDCNTDISLAGYANGLIPRSALCPLASAPNHVLRSDAANAFAALNTAYAEAFGTNIPVTDSYRTLAEQIDVKQRKPGLAATPGTSRHGLGIAVDLGGGIQNAGSPQHLWMDRNAALYGWINPAWAQNRGGQFEPWHWEFTD